jgi:transcriptional regulator with XRE-family HTH domain
MFVLDDRAVKMPRRRKADPLGQQIGIRIIRLREEKGLTQEKLAFESDVGSKGYLSDIEAGRALPSLTTLAAIADRLDVLLLDLLCFPSKSDRERLTSRLRVEPPSVIRRLLRELGPMPPVKAKPPRE